MNAHARSHRVTSPVKPAETPETAGLAAESDPKRRRRVRTERLIWLGIIALVAGIFGYTELIAPNLEPKRFGVVVAGEIYRSGEPTPGGLKSVVERYGIKTVLDLGAHTPGSHEELLAQRTADALGVERIRLNLEGDATGDPEYYATALRLIRDESKRPILVHCAAGSQRTGCAIAMFRQIEQGWTFEEAYEESFQFDHDPDDPNTFVRQMLEEWTWPVEVAVRTGGEVRKSRAGGPMVADVPADESSE